MKAHHTVTLITLLSAAASAFLCGEPVHAAEQAKGKRAAPPPCEQVLKDVKHPRFAQCLTDAYKANLR